MGCIGELKILAVSRLSLYSGLFHPCLTAFDSKMIQAEISLLTHCYFHPNATPVLEQSAHGVFCEGFL